MPGIDVYGFTSVFLKLLGLNFIPALEDASRFISLALGANIKGTNVFPAFLPKYNRKDAGYPSYPSRAPESYLKRLPLR